MSGYSKAQLGSFTRVNVAHTASRCRVLGPGERFVLWVQGCPLNCRGCVNPQYIPFREAAWTSVVGLAARIQQVSGLEGVTFVGGEPFAQARALARLARMVQGMGLSVMAYSGYTLEQLQSGRISGAKDLLAVVDLLMDGPYRARQPTERPWRGSDNQRLIALSSRYHNAVDAWNKPSGQNFELLLRDDGSLEVLGISPSLVEKPIAEDSC